MIRTTYDIIKSPIIMVHVQFNSSSKLCHLSMYAVERLHLLSVLNEGTLCSQFMSRVSIHWIPLKSAPAYVAIHIIWYMYMYSRISVLVGKWLLFLEFLLSLRACK